MSAEDKELRQANDREDAAERDSFDELARRLASGTLSRHQLLKAAGAAFVAGALSATFPGMAEAQRKKPPRGPTDGTTSPGRE